MSGSENLQYFAKCECGGNLVRVRRRWWQRMLYAAVYRCKDCGELRVRRGSSLFFSRKSLCPRCGTSRLRVLRKRDPVDSMSKSLLSQLQRLLGGELHHCEFCRLQFYDFRKVAAENPEKKAS